MSQALNLHFSDAVVNNEFSNCQFSLTQNKTCFLLTISWPSLWQPWTVKFVLKSYCLLMVCFILSWITRQQICHISLLNGIFFLYKPHPGKPQVFFLIPIPSTQHHQVLDHLGLVLNCFLPGTALFVAQRLENALGVFLNNKIILSDMVKSAYEPCGSPGRSLSRFL